ncbi:1,3-beta-glucanosyltransferase Gel1 [Microdochium trichocladiopsis]|uniref:1,3-beta-glucanosyltransferase n=1 Tax=Microdochium trichocladiopsis TaxID=1682393 RepID=A0A9P8Y1S0_9PEZI|nr:1,3-beta-glucanosyltransferase Gel1 [Microdochium trichocladiopsis]KAH7025979.1 1,3-beta-glucanosyltransferase Gel1 [Microdochium trichocladiopsis]
MRSSTLLSAALAAGAAAATPSRTTVELPRRAEALPAVSASGNAFWANGKRFYMRGIDYQPGGSAANLDPLANPTICRRDIQRFADLGVNTIRVYAVDNAADHTVCMQALNDAGIYLVLDVNNPQYSINRAKPAPSYNEVYLQSVFAVIDEFSKYSNTLAFFSGNEVINHDEGSTQAAPYVKATTRDMRQYMRNRGHRVIPVGYSAADVSDNRMQSAQYFNCGTDDERSDFFAFNDYSWCSPSSFTTSGWDVKVRNFTGYGLPIFLSEWGCITNGRDFSELSALMSSQMTGVYSGGLMYEYSLEENKFGIIDLTKNPVSELPEFGKFKSALSKYPAPTDNGGFVSTTNSVACPTTDSVWDLGSWGPTALPAIPEGAKKYMTEGAGKGPGLDGSGSQNSGEDVHTTASPGSGQPTTTPGSGNGNGQGGAAGHLSPPDFSIFAVTGVVAFCTLFGTLLL